MGNLNENHNKASTIGVLVQIPRAMQNSAPVLSLEEEEWGKELATIKTKMVKLSRTCEIIKKKNDTRYDALFLYHKSALRNPGLSGKKTQVLVSVT